MGDNWEITPHRFEAFFASKARCRESYSEAWELGRATYERLVKKSEENESLRARLALAEKVVEAARKEWCKCDDSACPWNNKAGDALKAYDAKER